MEGYDETSPLATILGRVKAKKELHYLDLRVDGLSEAVGHDVFVRYAARVPFEQLRSYIDKRRKSSPKAWELLSNLDLMVDSCAGVYAVMDGKEYGMCSDAPTDPAEWPRFDERLREALPEGAGEAAVSIARALFTAAYDVDERGKADAEILKHGNRLTQFYDYPGVGNDLGG